MDNAQVRQGRRKKCIYNDIDNSVLDIVERDSAILQGIGVSSSMPEYSLPIQIFGKNSSDPIDLGSSTTQDNNRNAGTNGADMDEQNFNEIQKEIKNKRKRIRPAAAESVLRILKEADYGSSITLPQRKDGQHFTEA